MMSMRSVQPGQCLCHSMRLLLLSLITLGLCSCRSAEDKAAAGRDRSSAEQAGTAASTSYEVGCSQRAWLGGKGNAGDAGYCDARLKLPLRHEPAWEWTYSRAELADANLSSLLHYDGTLIVSAYCPQIAGVRTSDGRELFNAVEYAPREGRTASREYFTSLYLHPEGLLLGSDNRSRRYCWEIGAGGLKRRWLREGRAEQSYLGVPVPGLSVACFQSGLHAMQLEDGASIWQQPVMQRNQRFRDNSNIVASDEGLVLWCSGFGDSTAFNGSDGQALWAAAGPASLRGLALDSRHGRAYFGYQNERLECRSLEDGALLWDFDWSILIPAEERARLQSEMEDGEPYRARIAGLTVADDGVIMSLYNGYCARLHADGSLMWKLRCDSMLFDALALQNAVVLTQFAAIPRSPQRRAAQGDRPLRLPPWPGLRSELAAASIVVPEYDPEQLNVTSFAGQLGGVALAVRYLVLDPASGAEIDSHEANVDFSVGPIPAYNMVLSGGGRRLSESLKPGSKEPRILQAFDWLEWEETR